MSLQFENDIIRPWDDLNALLAQPLALQPDLSEVTRRASALAIAIKHYPEQIGIQPRDVFENSKDNKIVSDLADSLKHRVLRDQTRQSSLYVATLIECDLAERFRFLRNGLFIEHASEGELDFLSVTSDAIRHWLVSRNLSIAWDGRIREGPSIFQETASLLFDRAYCIRMKNMRVKFFQSDGSGCLKPHDPLKVRLEVHQKER